MEDLPIEILTYIAVADQGYCYRELLAIPLFARFAIKNRKWLYEQMTEIVKDENKTEYRVFGKLHREDGPAVNLFDKVSIWYKWGQIHRDESQPWTREEIDEVYGDIESKYNNIDGAGPAVICHGENISMKAEWYQMGKLHRENGPAIEWRNGDKEWWRNGDLFKIYTRIQNNYIKKWFKNGLTHREGKPATIYHDGLVEWHQFGLLHREEGPAKIYPDGTELWYQFGKLHRIGGPAVIGPGNIRSWYKWGTPYREDGPVIENSAAESGWQKYSRLHREDGPAYEDKWYWRGSLISK